MVWAVGVMAISPIVNYVTPFLNPAYNNHWAPDIFYRLNMYWHGGIFLPWVIALVAVVYLVTGKGLVSVLKARHSKKMTTPIVALLIANMINIGADIGEMGSSVQLIVPNMPLVMLLKISNDKKILGNKTNGLLSNILGWMTVVIMGVSVIVMFVAQLI